MLGSGLGLALGLVAGYSVALPSSVLDRSSYDGFGVPTRLGLAVVLIGVVLAVAGWTLVLARALDVSGRWVRAIPTVTAAVVVFAWASWWPVRLNRLGLGR